jgi:cytochrome b561
MPIVGYIANSASNTPTPFFGLFSLPPMIGQNEDLSKELFTFHRWVGILVIILVLIHVSAALYHYFIRRDKVLQRMLPRFLGGY